MTPQELRILDALRRLTVNGMSPKLDDLAFEAGIQSKGSVHRILSRMRDKGVIYWKYHSWRAISIVREGPSREQIAAWSTEELHRIASTIGEVLADRSACET